jgi:hypothetical protein
VGSFTVYTGVVSGYTLFVRGYSPVVMPPLFVRVFTGKVFPVTVKVFVVFLKVLLFTPATLVVTFSSLVVARILSSVYLFKRSASRKVSVVAFFGLHAGIFFKTLHCFILEINLMKNFATKMTFRPSIKKKEGDLFGPPSFIEELSVQIKVRCC